MLHYIDVVINFCFILQTPITPVLGIELKCWSYDWNGDKALHTMGKQPLVDS